MTELCAAMSTIIEGLVCGLTAFSHGNAFYIITDVYAIFASQPRFGGFTAFSHHWPSTSWAMITRL
jgi:hypothetical protein